MQPIPTDEHTKEKRSAYGWAIAYLLLSIMFGITGWVLVFHHQAFLAIISLLGSVVCNFNSNKNFMEYKKYQEFDNER